jgi:CheY-like chemotaxis protein
MAPDRTILVVDDDAIVLRILADQIAREGYVVASATSNADALRHLNQTSFGVVIADQTMPELSGIDFLRTCRALQPLASRVLVTGNFGLPEIDRALRAGEICRLLIKPWTRFDLNSLLQQAYERHDLLRENGELRIEITTLENRVTDLARRLQYVPRELHASAGHQADLQSMNEKLLRAMEELRDRQQKAVREARLEALGKVASEVAHEFNNALIPILGYTELMLEKDQLLEDQEKARRYLRLVRTAAKDATRVADRLREFYQQAEKSEAPEPVDLGSAVSEPVPLTEGNAHPAETLGKKVPRVLKVLIVDDEKTSRDLVSLFLENDLHEVTAATSGAEALQFLRQGIYDLLVTDQEMPGMTGAALVDAVREGDGERSLPIIMVTGFGEFMKSSGTLPSGVDLVVNKPVTIEALRSALLKIFPEEAGDVT